MRTRLVIAAIGVTAISSCARANMSGTTVPAARGLTVEITSVPAGTSPATTIFLAGSFNGWRPGVPRYQLHYDGKGKYSLTVPDTLSGAIEFKFTKGSWETVETDSTGHDIPNRQMVVPADGNATYRGRIAGWHEPGNQPVRQPTARPSVSVISSNFEIPQLGRTRRVWVYVPPDYLTSGRRYPVLYMHDGQNVFDAATSFAGEWGVDEALDSLHVLGDPGVIVVAVDNGSDKRLDEYSPWPNAKYGGGEGDKYVDFLVTTLKPYIDSHYRTLPDRLNTAIAGSSMGGLISLYAVLKYPDVFSRAGVFSPALWFSPSIYSQARLAAGKPDLKIYFVSGALEAATGEEAGIYVKDQQRMVDSLVATGLRKDVNIVSLIQPDGTHAEWFWRREFPKAYLWLFGR